MSILRNQYTLNSEADTEQLAQTLADTIQHGIVFLKGDLGAGKTTLVRYWLQALGHTGRVKSPTYTLVEPYKINGQDVFHFDLYRLQNPEELDMMGFDEYLLPENLVIIEWASKAGYLAPEPRLVVEINVEDNVRKVLLTC